MAIEVWDHIPELKGNIVSHEPLRHQPGVRPGAEQHRDLVPHVPGVMVRPDTLGHRVHLMSRIVKDSEIHRPPGSPERLQFLLKANLIVSDKLQRSLHDLLCGPVVCSKKNSLRPRKILLKSQHDLRLRPAEPIDGLVIIPDDKEVIFRQR